MQVPYTLKNTQMGLSLVTLEDIHEGTIIWKNDHHPSVKSLTLDEIQNLPKEERQIFEMYCWQSDINMWDGTTEVCEDPINYINHSCNPNMHFINDDTLIARKFIEKGSNLTLEYATCDTIYAVLENCLCGESNCRNIVRTSDAFTIGKNYIPFVRSFIYKI